MGIFDKIREGLKKTRDSISGQITQMVNSFTKIDEELFEELEELLVMGDVGVPTATYITGQLRQKVKEKGITDPSLILGELKAIVADILQGDDTLHIGTKPSVILVIGVNGVGKTTTIGKLAARLRGEGKSVILGAADTFRAAAIEQLEVWAQRAGVPLIKHGEGADPAAVVFDTIAAAKARGCDVVICDTAGRLHNKKNLMDELGKISRVIDRELPGCDRETLLVLDAATGQNAVNQAREFQSAAGITGIVLTKLDGTPKGGVVLPIKRDLGLSVKFIGVGEQVDDLQPFDAAAFADALFDVQREEAPAVQEDRERMELDAAARAEERREEEIISEEMFTGETLEEEAVTEEPLIQDIEKLVEEHREKRREIQEEGSQPEEPSPEEPQSEEPLPEEPQPEKKKRRFWPFGRKRDEEE
ncbi:MAG TPA: signal recognition particle-docking protein FtsY [Candidatus Acutalibacter stercorigallinarum]|nr:signal recognition particle-docking protein FtsY [Candidatus Acutalibacter stercorigallinarum]